MASSQHKEQLADLLREYPSWGHAAISEREKGDEARKLLLEIEGAFLGYWDEIPQLWIQGMLPRIRECLGAWEPS